MSKQQNQFLDDLAKGAIMAAKKENCVSALMNDLVLIAKIFEESSEVKQSLQNASVSLEHRIDSLKKVLEGKMEPLAINVMIVLMEKDALNRLENFLQSVEKQAQELADYHACKVATAVEIPEKSKQHLVKALEKRLGGEVSVTYEINPAVIGGLSVTCGDWRYLGTVQNKLQQLSRHLAN
ncbi:MAG: ATP synthase F1 subunit delta [Patescibacteria group bacterium]|nr:ATP synthase F1 subunit delta [Patescibacteria group bacterium]